MKLRLTQRSAVAVDAPLHVILPLLEYREREIRVVP